ncbi:MAG TPA: hypothetical protein VFH54_12690 [Mycobacteriales bacterium]|nr:hypothetical protein [Mycobacteriales bacterium]
MTGHIIDMGHPEPNHRSVEPAEALSLMLDGGATLMTRRELDRDGVSAEVRIGQQTWRLSLELLVDG